MNSFNYYLNISEKQDPSMSNLGNEPQNESDQFTQEFEYALIHTEELFKQNHLPIPENFQNDLQEPENDKYYNKIDNQLEELFGKLFEQDYHAEFDTVNDVSNYTQLYKNLEQEFRTKQTKESKGKYRNELHKFLTLKLVDKYYSDIYEIYNNIINDMYAVKESKTVIYYNDILSDIKKTLNLFNLKYTTTIDKTEKYIYISLLENIYDGLAITIKENLLVVMKNYFFENTIDIYKNENDFYEFSIDCYQNDFIIEKNDDKLMYYLNILEQIENFLLLEENKYIFLNDAVDYSTDEDRSTASVMCYFSVKNEYYNKEFLNKLETEFYQYLQDNNMLLIDKSSVYVTTIDSPTIPNEVVISITDEYILFNESMGVSTNIDNIAANIYDVVKTKTNQQELSMNAMNNLVLTEEEKNQVMNLLSSGKYFNIHKVMDKFNSYLRLVQNESVYDSKNNFLKFVQEKVNELYNELCDLKICNFMKPQYRIGDDFRLYVTNNSQMLRDILQKHNFKITGVGSVSGNGGNYVDIEQINKSNESLNIEQMLPIEIINYIKKIGDINLMYYTLKYCGIDSEQYTPEGSARANDKEIMDAFNFFTDDINETLCEEDNTLNSIKKMLSLNINESTDLKQFYKKADLIYDKVKAKFKKKPYENAGQKEINNFEDSLPGHLSYQEKSKLMQYLNTKIDNISLGVDENVIIESNNITDVLFLYEEDNSDVFAYFPNEKVDDKYYTCYSHIGQHSACSPDYVANCKKATSYDYLSLQKELENIGYKLNILN